LPAHLMLVTPAAITTRRYWDFSTGNRVKLASFGEYAEAFRATFTEAVRRRMRSIAPVSVSVSGGLDSSSVFCVAAGMGPINGISYTSDRGDADERRYLPDLEQKYSATIQRIPIE